VLYHFIEIVLGVFFYNTGFEDLFSV